MQKHLGLADPIVAYVRDTSLRETDLMRRLRDETAKLPMALMQIPPEQGQFMALLIQAIGARQAIEIGTFTGYSALCVAQALPADGRLICCDVSEEWTSIGRRYWAEAGVADKIDLRIAPAADTLAALIAEGREGTFDFAFIDADKTGYPTYYEGVLRLLRTGGLIVFDNMLMFGRVADPAETGDTVTALRAINDQLHNDERVSVSLLPIADGVTLAVKR